MIKLCERGTVSSIIMRREAELNWYRYVPDYEAGVEGGGRWRACRPLGRWSVGRSAYMVHPALKAACTE
jgi:hypothetical protein